MAILLIYQVMNGTQLKSRVKAKLTQELIGTIHLLDQRASLTKVTGLGCA